MFALSLAQEEEGRAFQINRLYAFLGRYGHQDVRSLQAMTVAELVELSRHVGQLLEDEQAHSPLNTD